MPRLSFKGWRKEPHYNKIENQIDLTVSIIQAATMLDVVGEHAIKKGDTEAMLAVAAGWMQMATSILGEATEEETEGHEDVEEVLSDTKVMGFASPESREVMENAKEDSKRKARLQGQHGQLRNVGY